MILIILNSNNIFVNEGIFCKIICAIEYLISTPNGVKLGYMD